MNPIILYGKISTGETPTAERIKNLYGCETVIDEWDGTSFLPDGALAITSEKPPFNIEGAAVLHINVALENINKFQVPA